MAAQKGKRPRSTQHRPVQRGNDGPVSGRGPTCTAPGPKRNQPVAITPSPSPPAEAPKRRTPWLLVVASVATIGAASLFGVLFGATHQSTSKTAGLVTLATLVVAGIGFLIWSGLAKSSSETRESRLTQGTAAMVGALGVGAAALISASTIIVINPIQTSSSPRPQPKAAIHPSAGAVAEGARDALPSDSPSPLGTTAAAAATTTMYPHRTPGAVVPVGAPVANAPAPPASPARYAGVFVDETGKYHSFDGPGINDSNAASFGQQDVARGTLMLPNGQGGWTLTGDCGLHPMGTATPLATGVFFAGSDVCRGVAVLPDRTRGYFLLRDGSTVPWQSTPALPGSTALWPNQDSARGLWVHLAADGTPDGALILDLSGGLTGIGAVTTPQDPYFRAGVDWARGLAVFPDGSLYIAGGDGSLHPVGNPPALPSPPTWSTMVVRGFASYVY
jgi:hypothetical protein